jgi:hypothetical protein
MKDKPALEQWEHFVQEANRPNILNSLTRKLLQCFYLPKPKQYGEYVIEFKSFHQNGNISETVA